MAASIVLASLRGLTYLAWGKVLSRQARGGAGKNVAPRLSDTAGSPSRRRAQTWRSLFIAPCTLPQPRWTSILNILQVLSCGRAPRNRAGSHFTLPSNQKILPTPVLAPS